jgi:DNA-binding XRE family transcriptional regulator
MHLTADGKIIPFIREWRELEQPTIIKQAVLAREVGIHEISLSRIERGKTEPSVTTALKICEAMSRLLGRDISVEHVFYHSDDGSDIAWAALSNAEDEVHRASEKTHS